MKRINVRDFQRKMYDHLEDIPLIIYNNREGKDVFCVIPVQDFEDYYKIELQKGDDK